MTIIVEGKYYENKNIAIEASYFFILISLWISKNYGLYLLKIYKHIVL